MQWIVRKSRKHTIRGTATVLDAKCGQSRRDPENIDEAIRIDKVAEGKLL